MNTYLDLIFVHFVWQFRKRQHNRAEKKPSFGCSLFYYFMVMRLKADTNSKINNMSNSNSGTKLQHPRYELLYSFVRTSFIVRKSNPDNRNESNNFGLVNSYIKKTAVWQPTQVSVAASPQHTNAPYWDSFHTCICVTVQ